MSVAEKTVFISYRRSVSRHLARAITLDLRAHAYDVFFDVDTVDNGEFDRIVLHEIAARMHFVLVLSRGSLERCAEEGDWLRREIEEALKHKRNIVPIWEAGFSFQAEAKYLPESLRDLPRFNGLPLYHFYFDAAMEALRTRFLKPTEDEGSDEDES
jgi:TIR domain